MHEGFNVEDVRDVMCKELLEILSCRWQIFVHHQFEEEAEVLIAMEADPCECVVEDEPRRHHFFREVQRRDAVMLEAVEV